MANKALTRSRSCGAGGRYIGRVRPREQCLSADIQPLLSSCDLSSFDVSLLKSDTDDASCFSVDLNEMFGLEKEGDGEGDERRWEEGWRDGGEQMEGWCADTTQVRHQ